MRIVLAQVRASRTPWADDAAADYVRRIGRTFPCEEAHLRAGDAEAAARQVKALVPPRGRLVVLDERGRGLDSLTFASWLGEQADQGCASLVFALGGPYGHSDTLRRDAFLLLRVSDFVLNHAVARVLVLEQIYRACTLRAGTPYHHG